MSEQAATIERERNSLRALLKEAADALDECSRELAEWVEHNYEHTKNHPGMLRRYERDIEPATQARAMAARLRAQEGGGG